MAYPRSCNKDASIHVPLPLQTLLLIISAVVVLAASSMLSVAAGRVAAAEPPSGGYRFRLTHVDGHGNFTKDELILRAAERGRRRAAVLRALTTTSHTSGSGEEIRHPVHYHDHEYLMDVKVRGQTYHAIVDTGSSLIWMKPPRQQPAEEKSRVLCNAGLCVAPCKCEGTSDRDGCSFRTRYADGFRIHGEMFQETLSFDPPEKELKGIAIGWAQDDFDGTVGLGRGKQSLVEQLHAHTFSYCLATYDKPDLESVLLLDSPKPKPLDSACSKSNDNSCQVRETPLLENKADPSRYYVHLESIKIGDKTIDMPKPKSEVEEEEATTVSPSPTPNMFIDSGSSFTELEAKVYQDLVKHLNKEVLKKDGKKHHPTFCWAGTKDQISMLPEYLELHFTGAVMYLDKDKVMYEDEVVNKDGPKICLAIHEADHKSQTSVLGNFQQQNIHMHFDFRNENTNDNKLSFVKVDDCKKVK